MKAIVALSALCLATAVEAGEIPKFQVDAAWPKTLPNGWIMGQAAGVAVDAQDHIWVVQRPKSLTDDEKKILEEDRLHKEDTARLRAEDYQLSYAIDILRGMSYLAAENAN